MPLQRRIGQAKLAAEDQGREGVKLPVRHDTVRGLERLKRAQGRRSDAAVQRAWIMAQCGELLLEADHSLIRSKRQGKRDQHQADQSKKGRQSLHFWLHTVHRP